MKALKLATAIVFASALALLSSCSKEGEISVQPEAQLSENYSLVDFEELSAPEVSDGITGEFKLRKPEKHMDKTPCDRPHKKQNETGKRGDGEHKDGNEKEDRHNLGGVLHKMELSQEQKVSIQKFKQEHCRCIAEHLKKVLESNMEVIAQYNNKREELLKAAKSGRISRQELERKLQHLKAQLHREIQSNRNKEAHITAMKKCEAELVRNIGSILNSRQMEVWKKWLANR